MTWLARDPTCAITQDDLLRFAIKWVKENRGDGPDFVPEVAVVLEMLKGEFLGPASLIESYDRVPVAAVSVGEVAGVRQKVSL